MDIQDFVRVEVIMQHKQSFNHSPKRRIKMASSILSLPTEATTVDDDELMLNVLRCHLTY